MKNILEYAFIDKWLPQGSLLVSKAEVAVLCQVQGRNTMIANTSSLESISIRDLRRYSGAHAFHLERQYWKESCEKLTVFHRQFVTHEGRPYFIKGYKFVNETHFKLEATPARGRDEDLMPLKPVLRSSMRLLEQIVGGAMPWLLPCYMHRKDFTPVSSIIKSF